MRERDKEKSSVNSYGPQLARNSMFLDGHVNNHLEGSRIHYIPLARDWYLTVNNQSTTLLYALTT